MQQSQEFMSKLMRKENGKIMIFSVNEMTLFATTNANLPLLFLAASPDSLLLVNFLFPACQVHLADFSFALCNMHINM